ncbi:MAG: hypothetical protein ABIG36_05840 [Pseudomonadota bacterium]
MSVRLIFLDIDGVMHSVDRVQTICTSTGIEYSGERLFEHLPLFGRILDQCPDPRSDLPGFSASASLRLIDNQRQRLAT